MKKVLFCATVESHIRHFHIPYLKYFKELGYEVHVASKGTFECPYIDEYYDIPFERSPFKSGNFKAYIKLKKVIDQNKYDIIHCHTPMGGALTRLAAIKSRKSGTKVIYTAHGFHFYKGAPLLNWMIYYPVEKMLAHFTDCIITINQEDYKLAKSKFKAGRVELISGVGVDTDKFKPVSLEQKTALREKYGYKNDDFLMMYSAEFNKNKNQELLLHAMSQIKDKVPSAKLLLAGKNSGCLSKCIDLTKKYKIEDKVVFLGYRRDLDKILPMCDICVSSSKREGLPLNILEALACGLPVAASKIRGHIDIIQGSSNGYLFSNNDELISCVTKIHDLIINGSSNVNLDGLKKYSLKVVKDKVCEIYNTCLSTKV